MAIGVGIAGEKYEKAVKSVIRKVTKDNKGIIVVPDGTSTFSKAGVDCFIKVNGVKHAFEIKASARAQMGGANFRYDNMSKQFSISEKDAKTIDSDTAQMLIETLGDYRTEYERFFTFINKFPPKAFHQGVTGSPMVVTKEAWIGAVEKGLLKKLNVNVEHNSEYIHSHYSKKGVHYIQIGGAGLFYLKKNPLKLPIPRLEGKVIVELRLAQGGAREKKDLGIVVGANIRGQARLATKLVSDYSLDDPEDVNVLFNHKG